MNTDQPPRLPTAAPDGPPSADALDLPVFSTLRTSSPESAAGNPVRPTVRVVAREDQRSTATRGGASLRVGVPVGRNTVAVPLTDVGWTQPTRTKPFVTRLYSGVRIKLAD